MTSLVKTYNFYKHDKIIKKAWPTVYEVFSKKPPTPGYDYFKQVAMKLKNKAVDNR